MYPFDAANRDSPKITPPHSSVSTRVAHYALIWLDEKGMLNIDESPSIQKQGVSVFTPEVRRNFLATLRKRSIADGMCTGNAIITELLRI